MNAQENSDEVGIDVQRLVRRLMDTVETTAMEYPPFCKDVRHACLELERLNQWKREGMRVLGEWESVWVAAGSPGRLGQSKAEAVRELIAAQLHISSHSHNTGEHNFK
jgi:hypothetical protein